MLVVLLLCALPVAALWHIAGLQVISGVRGADFLQEQGEARTVRNEEIPAYRGLITDRRGEPLAVSTPVVSIVADPKYLRPASRAFAALAEELGVSQATLAARLRPMSAEAIVALSPGLSAEHARAARTSP